ncbi:MAG: flagellar motor protein, partial [Ignavibacteriales bacterium]|nr:flagellar motor protein [Ignavibacteriales bacterium]
MKRKHQAEEPENHERWLLTYADLITLLLGLFVILYAMSKVDSAKYAELISALSGVF